VDAGFAEMEMREEQDDRVENFRKHVDAGRISETDFHLLVGTLVYGRRLSECAEDVGLNYQAAKKRRQRAGAAIRRFEELSKKNAPTCPHPRLFTRSVLMEANDKASGGLRP